MPVPSHYTLIYPSDVIQSRVLELGREISAWISADASDVDVAAIPLLRGGLYFFADLSRALSHSVEVLPLRVSSYLGKEGNKASEKIEIGNAPLDVRGKRALIIDDICDSGRTLEALVQKMEDEGALEVKTAALIKRDILGTFEPDWIGFRHKGAEWLVGYGMDDRERQRNLGGIYFINK